MFGFIKDNKYIAMDYESGGYPYETDNELSIKLWRTIEDANNYYSHFPKEHWILKRINLEDI